MVARPYTYRERDNLQLRPCKSFFFFSFLFGDGFFFPYGKCLIESKLHHQDWVAVAWAGGYCLLRGRDRSGDMAPVIRNHASKREDVRFK